MIVYHIHLFSWCSMCHLSCIYWYSLCRGFYFLPFSMPPTYSTYIFCCSLCHLTFPGVPYATKVVFSVFPVPSVFSWCFSTSLVSYFDVFPMSPMLYILVFPMPPTFFVFSILPYVTLMCTGFPVRSMLLVCLFTVFPGIPYVTLHWLSCEKYVIGLSIHCISWCSLCHVALAFL